MIAPHLLAVFVAALAVVYALPGPDMALIMQTSIARGARHGLAAAAGLGVARATHVTLSACGVAALLRNAPWLYSCVRYAGAAYLVWVGVQILRSPAFALTRATESEAGSNHTLHTSFAKGLLTNLMNPKALLFCSVLLPQFIRPEAGPVAPQVIELGIILLVIGACFDAIYVGAAARIAVWLRAHPFAQTLQRWTFCAALIAFAARLSLD